MQITIESPGGPRSGVVPYERIADEAVCISNRRYHRNPHSGGGTQMIEFLMLTGEIVIRILLIVAAFQFHWLLGIVALLALLS